MLWQLLAIDFLGDTYKNGVIFVGILCSFWILAPRKAG